MKSNARFAWIAGALLWTGCADHTLPEWPTAAALESVEVTDTVVTLQWPAATDNREMARYQLSKDSDIVAEIPAEAEPSLTVTGLVEFTQYTFAVEALDATGNISEPLTVQIRTADVTPPTWAEGCKFSWEMSEPGNLDAGIEFTWCEATDNDRLDHFELWRGQRLQEGGSAERYGIIGAGSEPLSFPPGETTHIWTDSPLDGTYTLAACDPTGNCAELLPIRVDEESKARRSAIQEAMSNSLIALLGSYDSSDSIFGGLAEADIFGSSDLAFEGLTGLSGGIGYSGDDYAGMGGLGTRGSGVGGGGGGGGGGGVGVVAMRGSSTYRAASASLKPGGQADLAAHVSKRMSRIDHCYQQARTEDRQLKGSLTIRLTADGEGSITVDGVSGPDAGGLTSCVTSSLRGRLAEPPGEAVSGTFSVTLDPGAA